MPFSYRVEPSSGFLMSTWSGRITAEDLGRFWKDVLSDPAIVGCGRGLTDLRQAQIAFTGSELGDLVDGVVRPLLAGRPWRAAILAGAPAQYGTARQFEVFAQGVTDHAIFTDEETAIAWLVEEDM